VSQFLFAVLAFVRFCYSQLPVFMYAYPLLQPAGTILLVITRWNLEVGEHKNRPPM